MMDNDDDFDARLRDAVNGETLDTSALQKAIRGRIARRWSWGGYAAVAAAAALVVLAIWMGRVPVSFHQAVRDHQLEVVEHRPRHWRPTAGAISVQAPSGYRLEHAKICGLEGKPVWHLVYANGAHEVSVYVTPTRMRGDADVDGQHVTAFRTGQMTGLVVGSAAECRQFADVIQKTT